MQLNIISSGVLVNSPTCGRQVYPQILARVRPRPGSIDWPHVEPINLMWTPKHIKFVEIFGEPTGVAISYRAYDIRGGDFASHFDPLWDEGFATLLKLMASVRDGISWRPVRIPYVDGPDSQDISR